MTTGKLAKNLSFLGRFGRSCSEPFYAEAFLKGHPQWAWQKGYLKDRPSQPWTLLEAKK